MRKTTSGDCIVVAFGGLRVFYLVMGFADGHLAPRQILVALWTKCAMDIIGPWKIRIHGREILHFKVFVTGIYQVTNLSEIIRINIKPSSCVAQKIKLLDTIEISSVTSKSYA